LLIYVISGKMLSWASYLFGSSTAEPQQDEQPSEPAQPVAMETEASSDKDWVVVEHKGMFDL
jgi:hypothetical protein